MTRAGVSERRRASVGELTPDRFRELRWVAEAVSDVRFEVAGSTGRRMGINGIPFSFECGECGFLLETNQAVVALSPVGYFIANFDPPTALALLDEIERLRRELDSVADIAAAALDHVRKRYSGDAEARIRSGILKWRFSRDGEKGGGRA